MKVPVAFRYNNAVALRRTISIGVRYYTLTPSGLKLFGDAGENGAFAELFEGGFEVVDDFPGENAAHPLAAVTMISTSVPGVSAAPTAQRAGKFFLSTHAIQASFISFFRLASAM